MGQDSRIRDLPRWTVKPEKRPPIQLTRLSSVVCSESLDFSGSQTPYFARFQKNDSPHGATVPSGVSLFNTPHVYRKLTLWFVERISFCHSALQLTICRTYGSR